MQGIGALPYCMKCAGVCGDVRGPATTRADRHACRTEERLARMARTSSEPHACDMLRAMPEPERPSLASVQHWMEAIYIAVAGAHLRDEDRRKSRQVLAMLDEVARALRGMSARREVTIVDAAAGKSYLGLLAAKLVVEPSGRAARVVTIERDPARVAASAAAVTLLASRVPIECREGLVTDEAVWPQSPSLVVALHACGTASDDVIAQAIARRARMLLLVPCCTSDAVVQAAPVERWLSAAAMPPHAPVRVRFTQAIVDADRTWRLEVAGYETEVVEFVGATVTPHNLLWRARLVGEPRRMAAAASSLRELRGERAGTGEGAPPACAPHDRAPRSEV